MTFLELAKTIDEKTAAITVTAAAQKEAEAAVEELKKVQATELAKFQAVAVDRARAHKEAEAHLKTLFEDMHAKMAAPVKPEPTEPTGKELKELYIAGQATRKNWSK